MKGRGPGWAKHSPGKRDCVLAAALDLGPGGAGMEARITTTGKDL